MKTVRKNFEVALMADCIERRSSCKSHNFKSYKTVFIYACHITKENDFACLGDKSVFIYMLQPVKQNRQDFLALVTELV